MKEKTKENQKAEDNKKTEAEQIKAIDAAVCKGYDLMLASLKTFGIELTDAQKEKFKITYAMAFMITQQLM